MSLAIVEGKLVGILKTGSVYFAQIENRNGTEQYSVPLDNESQIDHCAHAIGSGVYVEIRTVPENERKPASPIGTVQEEVDKAEAILAAVVREHSSRCPSCDSLEYDAVHSSKGLSCNCRRCGHSWRVLVTRTHTVIQLDR